MIVYFILLFLILWISYYRARLVQLERRVDELERKLMFAIKETDIDLGAYRWPEAALLLCKAEDREGAKELIRKKSKGAETKPLSEKQDP